MKNLIYKRKYRPLLDKKYIESGDWSTGRNMFNTFDDFKIIKIKEKVE